MAGEGPRTWPDTASLALQRARPRPRSRVSEPQQVSACEAWICIGASAPHPDPCHVLGPPGFSAPHSPSRHLCVSQAAASPLPWCRRGLPVKFSVNPSGSHRMFLSSPSDAQGAVLLSIPPWAPASPARPLLRWCGLASGSLLGALRQQPTLPSPCLPPSGGPSCAGLVLIGDESPIASGRAQHLPSTCPPMWSPSRDWLGAKLPLLCLGHLLWLTDAN